MREEESPFRPGRVVDPDFFVGRAHEMEVLRTQFRIALKGAPTLVFIEGERGIGKTSLGLYGRHLLEAQEDAASAYVMLSHAESTNDAVRLIAERLVDGNVQAPWHKKVLGVLGGAFQEASIAGVRLKIRPRGDELGVFKEQFVYEIKKICDELEGERSGVLVIMDELNGLSESREFATWVKAVLDEPVAQRMALPLCIAMIGLPEARGSLIESHPSLARSMKTITIKPWTLTDTTRFYVDAFESAGAKVDPDALATLVSLTGGVPAYAHEIGNAVWCVADDLHITTRVAEGGLFQAAELIGRKIFKPRVLDAIRSKKYRAILRKLSKRNLNIRFTRRELIGDLDASEKNVLDNFLRKLRKLGAIERDEEGGVGTYKFCSYMHRFYFWLEASRAHSP